MNVKHIKVFDTTLRDGEQGIGCCMDINKKKKILQKLDSLNLDFIELGFPAASKEDSDWIKTALSMELKTKACVFTRLNKNDIDCLINAVNGENVRVQILAIGSEIHLHKKRKISLSESLIELRNAIQYLKGNGLKNIFVILEDATRGSFDLLNQIVAVCIEENIDGIMIADTVGCATPKHIASIIRQMKSIMPESMELGIHCHNDMGLATANTLSAIEAGASIIQTTLGGIGERAGNCALEEVFSVLYFCPDEYKAKIEIDPIKLHDACHFLFEELQRPLSTNKPVLGEHVFSTSAGLHQDGLIKDRSTYEYVRPDIFGRKHKFIFNRLSGRRLIKSALADNLPAEEVFENFYIYLLERRTDFKEDEIIKEFEVFKVLKALNSFNKNH